jgi:hypothetical protein
MLLAAFAGACWDEYTRAGWSAWISLCRTTTPDWGTSLRLYAALLPTSVAAILLAGLALLLVSGLARDRCAVVRGGLAGHLSCLAAMPLSIYLCALWASSAASRSAGAIRMLLLDVAIVGALLTALRFLASSRAAASPRGSPASHAQR